MNEQEREAKREELVRELVKVMKREPKTPHEVERKAEACKRLQDRIDTLRTAGGHRPQLGQGRHAPEI